MCLFTLYLFLEYLRYFIFFIIIDPICSKYVLNFISILNETYKLTHRHEEDTLGELYIFNLAFTVKNFARRTIRFSVFTTRYLE